MGEYYLTNCDVIGGKKFNDVIARGCCQCDIHNVTQNPNYKNMLSDCTVESTWIENQDSFDIPYRCLLPKNVDGMLIIGRCISAEHVAHGSIRTQSTIMAEGHAAGIAAKLAVEKKVSPREINIHDLQSRLLETGAILYRDIQEIAQDKHNAMAAIRLFLQSHSSITLPEEIRYYMGEKMHSAGLSVSFEAPTEDRI